MGYVVIKNLLKNNKLFLLFILNIIFVLVIILLFIIVLNNIDYPSAAAVTESNNGSTVIEIKAVFNWKITLFLSIVIIVLDCIIFTTFKILQYLKNKRIKEKYILLIICIFNLLFTILLFPGMILPAIIIDVLIIMIYIIKTILNKKHKSDGSAI